MGIGFTIEDHPKPKPGNFHELLKQIQHPTAIDLNVTLVQLKDKTVGFNESTNMNSIDFTDIVYNPYAGLEYEQEMSVWVISLNQVFKW